jgi:hypothetical protein
MKWLGRWWRRRQRAVDLEILWPSFRDMAPDLDHAKAGFAYHALRDPAWTRDFSEGEILDIIDRFEAGR